MEWPEVVALQEQGHTIETEDTSLHGILGLARYDLILAPNAWRMTEDLRPFLPLAIQAVRKARYGAGENTSSRRDARSPLEV